MELNTYSEVPKIKARNLSKQFWLNVLKLKNAYGVSDEALSEGIDKSLRSYRASLSKLSTPKEDEIEKICKYFDVPDYLMFNPDFDEQVHLLASQGKFNRIPKIYEVDLGSKMRTFEGAVQFADKVLGKESVDYILNRMQISRKAIGFADKDISLRIFIDFHLYCRALVDDNDDFYIQMGASNGFQNKKIKQDYVQKAKEVDTSSLYRYMNEYLIPRVDNNFDYKIVSCSNCFVHFRSTPKEEMQKKLGSKRVGSYEVALFRFGHFLGFPAYFGLEPAYQHLSKLEYDHENDVADFYLVFENQIKH